jgi:ketosteroid isomerase-like protein
MDMKADAATEKAVMVILQNFNDALAGKQVEQLLSLFAPDADVFLLGSEEGEKAIGHRELEDFFRRIFSRFTAFYFEWKWHLVSMESSVAWVFTEGLVHAKTVDQTLEAPYRSTMVLVKRGDKWLIMHAHGSRPTTKRRYD